MMQEKNYLIKIYLESDFAIHILLQHGLFEGFKYFYKDQPILKFEEVTNYVIKEYENPEKKYYGGLGAQYFKTNPFYISFREAKRPDTWNSEDNCLEFAVMPDPKNLLMTKRQVDDQIEECIDIDFYVRMALLFCRDYAILHFQVNEI